MSWPPRPPGAAPERAPAAAPQLPAQVYGNQQNTYGNYQGPPPTAANTQQQYWQAQQPLYNQQYGQVYQQQDFGNNANQLYQQPQYNQNYTNQTYATTQQQGYQPNYYQSQGAPQQGYQNKPNPDAWEDNWDWGWDESAKQAQQAAAGHTTGAMQPGIQPQQQPAFNNANVIEESFSTADTWNWASEEKKETVDAAASQQDTKKPPVENISLENNTVTEPVSQSSSNNLSAQAQEEVRNLGDRDIVKERLPNLALGKRMHLDNLTPQWSIESQMSQESSDGPQTHSEGTYRSENQSRNSSKSSPVPTTDNSNFNYTHSGFEEWSHHSNEESTLVDNVPPGSRRESHDELATSLQEMNITTNKENPAPESHSKEVEPRKLQDNAVQSGQPTVSAASFFPSMSSTMPPVSSVSSTNVTAGLVASSAGLPPPPSSSILPPPTNFPPSSSSSNPFKQSGPFSHRKPSTSPSLQTSSTPTFPPPTSSTNLVSPAAVNKVSQHRVPVGFGANLETTPDNSERPDQPQMPSFRPMPVAQPVPDNLEVAPRNDRNEYLQTAHLSSGDYGENTDFSRNGLPPGLRRMVVGQQESEYNQSSNMGGDEPPPGLARMVPGQQTEAYGQADEFRERAYGQRRPVGLARMVPGSPSNEQYPPFPAGYGEPRVVTGGGEYPGDGPALRDQNMDGSDYSGGARSVPGQPEPPEDAQREVTVEGENLQDLSVISSSELTFSRDQTLEGAAVATDDADRKTDASDSLERPSGSRRHSLNRGSTGDDSERDRTFKASPRRDRDKHKSTRERDRERERDEGRYSRGDRKHERDERRAARDGRSARDGSPRRARRAARNRYETEDTDYYSDRERDRRRYREGSYASKPPRPEDKDRRYEQRERSRRYNTIERERRPHEHDERDGRSRRSERRDRERERYEARYRDIDPTRKHGNLRLERDDEERRRGEYSSPSRAESRDAGSDDGAPAERRSHRRSHGSRHNRSDPYYDSYGYGGGYALQRQQYEYYEQLRVRNPAAYMAVYKQLLAGRAPPPYDVYGSLGYEARTEERGSVHSGRSSANGMKNDTYSVRGGGYREGSLRDAPSLRTDGSDRDLNTDASLNLHLEESTVRSERMTPFKFSTAHVKANISVRDIVVVRPSYPVDGLPATVHVLPLRAHAPLPPDLAACPGPLVRGVTHKKSVIDYCTARIRNAARAAPRDVIGYVLLWELLALMLRQNGVVVGADIAELLMKNTREYEYNPAGGRGDNADSRRGSAGSGRDEGRTWSPEQPSASASDLTPTEEPSSAQAPTAAEERAALDRFREYLTYGNRQEALEWAMSNGLWGHALALAAFSERRVRAGVAARFMAALPRADPLHTLYAHLHARTPPAATCCAEARWADWRPHAAMMLANCSAKPDADRHSLTLLGDSLLSRGLLYCAQFCYIAGGVAPSRHPLAPLQPPPAPPAPPRLALLLADSRATTLRELATNQAILATEIYEYALSLNQDYVINDFQVYKLILASRLMDAGLYERALAYVEQAARAVTRAPQHFATQFIAQLAQLADRLKYHDPALQEDPPLVEEGAPNDSDSSPRHQQWLDDVRSLANMLVLEQSSPQQQSTPQHSTPQHSFHGLQNQYAFQEQPQQQYAPQPYIESEETPDYSLYYEQQQQLVSQQQQLNSQHQQLNSQHQQLSSQQQLNSQHQQMNSQHQQPEPATEVQPSYDEWQRTEAPPSYGDNNYYGYEEGAGAGAAGEEQPRITMPGATAAKPALYAEYDDDRPPTADNQTEREADSGKQPARKVDKPKEDSKGGWLGGILTKLSLRPPNQMILPDDKNPSIVWDAEQKRWRSVDGDDDVSAAPPPPPPKAAPPAPPAHTQQQQSAPPAAPVSNIFKMQKGRHIKKSYVDVFNPSGAPTRPLPPPAEVLGPAPVANAAPTYFVPHSAPQGGIYDSSQLETSEDDIYRSGI